MQEEISPDDQEAEGNTMDIDEDEEIELGGMDVDAADDGEPYTVCHCETAPFLVLMSRSAHPGALIGGRAKKLEVIAYMDGRCPGKPGSAWTSTGHRAFSRATEHPHGPRSIPTGHGASPLGTERISMNNDRC